MHNDNDNDNGVYLYSWTTNGGERGYIYIFMFLEHAVCIISFLFFFCNNIGFLLLGRCMVNTLA